jgi:hypothetical protein
MVAKAESLADHERVRADGERERADAERAKAACREPARPANARCEEDPRLAEHRTRVCCHESLAALNRAGIPGGSHS